jgi:hypothetical protein
MARNEDGKDLIGKDVIVYNSRHNRNYSSSDVSDFLKPFQLNEALLLIGGISYHFFESGISHP